jgi:Zn-dependent protease with chaperone function
MKKLIAILLLSSCNLIDPPTHVTDDLQPFVDRVVYEYNIRGVYVKPIKVVLGDFTDNANAKYYTKSWDRKIVVSKNYFVNAYDYEILKTISHEIGHYMGREHNNKEIDYEPISLMCTRCVVWSFESMEEYYFDELVGVKLNKE